MYNYEILEVEQFTPSEIQAFESLQQPYLKSSPLPIDLLSPENRKLLAIRVTFGQEPVALLLARMFYASKIGEILSLCVAPKYRRQKVATQMIHLLKQKGEVDEIKQMGFVYPTNVPETPLLEQFLKNTGFSQKRFTLAEFQFDYAQFHPPWFEKNYAWPKDFEVFPWTELRYEDIPSIDKKYANKVVPFDVYPFFHSASFEPLNSLGLRYKGEVIGWVINERTLPDTINYRNIYVDYDFQFRGVAIYLLVESVQIHTKNNIKWGIFQINMLSSSASWLHFVRRRLAPYANYIYEYSSQSLFPAHINILNKK
jgi:GNAT superfamily N-acetyltransferase